MKRVSWLLPAVCVVTLFMGTACKRGADGPDLTNLGPSSSATSTVLPVGSQPCPGGGIGIYSGKDANGNGVLEASEFQKGTPVCDTLSDGKPAGLLTLVMVASEPSGTVHCAAGGLKVLSGGDANRNGVLDAQEIAYTEYLCNGTPGASSAAGITVAAAQPAPPAEEKKKGKKTPPAKKQAAVSGKTAGKAAAGTASEAQTKKQSAEATAAPEGTGKPAEAAPAAKKAADKSRPASAKKEKSGPAAAVVPQGWTPVKAGNSQSASVVYKVEGRYIIVRFTNLSSTSGVRFKYTVRWKVNQNGNWVDDSTMEGISFSLKPQETLDREVRTQASDIRDVVIDLSVVETS